MKKLTLLLLLTAITTFLTAQSNVLGLRVPMAIQLMKNNTQFMVGPGATFQHALKSNKVVIGLNFDYMFGFDQKSFAIINVEPRVDYYFKEAFDGFHLGSNIGFNMFAVKNDALAKIKSSFAGMQLGATLGYAVPIGEKMMFDIGTGIGYTVFFDEKYNQTVTLPTTPPTTQTTEVKAELSSLGFRPALTLAWKL